MNMRKLEPRKLNHEISTFVHRCNGTIVCIRENRTAKCYKIAHLQKLNPLKISRYMVVSMLEIDSQSVAMQCSSNDTVKPLYSWRPLGSLKCGVNTCSTVFLILHLIKGNKFGIYGSQVSRLRGLCQTKWGEHCRRLDWTYALCLCQQNS